MQDIEKWSLNDRRLAPMTLNTDTFEEPALFQPVNKRPGFLPTLELVKLPAYFVRFVGVQGEEDPFYNNLFRLHNKWSRLGDLYLKFDEGLDKALEPDVRNSLGKAWNAIARLPKVEPAKISEVVAGSGAVVKLADKRHAALMVEALERTFAWYCQVRGDAAKPNEAKNIAFYVVQWFNRYCGKILPAFDFGDVNPKVIFYGAPSKWEVYFLAFLHFVGADVLCFCTQEDEQFDAIDPNKTLAHVVSFSRRLEPRPFPTTGSAEVLQTDAKRASNELRETLHSDDSFCYRPWQFIDYSVSGVILRSTIDEVFMLAPEKAMIRSGWEVNQGHVSVPNIVAKISGVYKDKNKYFKMVNKIKELPKAVFADTLPLIPALTTLKKAEYYASLDKEKKLDSAKARSSGYWPYAHLPDHLQKLIAEHMGTMCTLKGLKRIGGEPIEVQKLRVFSSMLQIPKNYLELMQTFDYPSEVPKLVVYNFEENGTLSFEDGVLIRMLASVGFDVIIFNPAGHNDIETFIEADCFDSHRLEEVAFGLQFRSRSIMGRYF